MESIPRVLVVEDEWLLAETVEEAIRDLGYDVMGSVATVREALELIGREEITVAVLDISLNHGEKSFPIARALRERGIPFLFLTGYLNEDLPPEFSGEPTASKPLIMRLFGPQLQSILPRGPISARP
jgi:CheY-like chemotaxis protein